MIVSHFNLVSIPRGAVKSGAINSVFAVDTAVSIPRGAVKSLLTTT